MRRTLRTHRCRRFNSSDFAIGRFVGTGASANIYNAASIAESCMNLSGNTRIRLTETGVCLPNGTVVCITCAAVRVSHETIIVS